MGNEEIPGRHELHRSDGPPSEQDAALRNKRCTPSEYGKGRYVKNHTLYQAGAIAGLFHMFFHVE